MQEPNDAPGFGEHGHDHAAAEDEEQRVERQLAQYAFVREERGREVRLQFREAPAPQIAAAFREAGAALISITGERVPPTGADSDTVPLDKALEASTGQHRPRHSRKGSQRSAQAAPAQGEVLLRYFFALRETVYTVSLTSPSGTGRSVAGIYPAAHLLERELQTRLAMVFTRTEC
jgi:hypothetical protein